MRNSARWARLCKTRFLFLSLISRLYAGTFSSVPASDLSDFMLVREGSASDCYFFNVFRLRNFGFSASSEPGSPLVTSVRYFLMVVTGFVPSSGLKLTFFNNFFLSFAGLVCLAELSIWLTSLPSCLFCSTLRGGIEKLTFYFWL